MFEQRLDTERTFAHHGTMHRTHVRRRRVSLTVLVALALAGLIGPVARAVAGPSLAPVAHRTYVVHGGDTLWSIAARVTPSEDPRPVVARIQQANHLGAGAIVPGQTLTVPLAN